MTDAHCHVAAPGATRRLICPLEDPPRGRISVKCAAAAVSPRGRISVKCAAAVSPRGRISAKCANEDIFFYGIHPWHLDGPRTLATVRERLLADPRAGVGEIGLDRLRDRTISPRMREIFVAQLELAAEFHRPVVLHGAKCWGEVVKTVRPFAGSVPAFLFHGFSRSDGLIPDIVALNGFISVGPAVLNDHAVNYRALVAKIPADRLLVETDATAVPPGSVPMPCSGSVPNLADIVAKVAVCRKVSIDILVETLEENANRFLADVL